MARPEHHHPDLRATVPTLEPDEAFLARLSELAAGSGTSRPPAGVPSQPGWRVGLAAASVAALVGGVTWLATTVSGDESPPPPVGPVTQPTEESPDSTENGPQGVPTGRSESGAGHDGTTGRGSSDPDGVSGSSVGSAPGGQPGGQSGGQNNGQDDGQGDQAGGNDQGQQQGQDGDGQGQQGDDSPGRSGDDHGQQDGNGDESQGRDGQPHGQNNQPHGNVDPPRGQSAAHSQQDTTTISGSSKGHG